MEIDKQNSPQSISTPPTQKKWYQHKGLLSVLLLVILSVGVIGIYLIKNYPRQYGNIAISHSDLLSTIYRSKASQGQVTKTVEYIYDGNEFKKPDSPPAFRRYSGDILPWSILCTNSLNEALSYAQDASRWPGEADNQISAQNENEKYFEFTLNPQLAQKIYHVNEVDLRINKCSYITISPQAGTLLTNVDTVSSTPLNKELSGTIGTFNLRPINKQNAEDLLNYLWNALGYNMRYTNSIISSDFSETKDSFVLKQTFYVDWGRSCANDLIGVFEYTLKVDTTGLITNSVRKIDNFEGTHRGYCF